MFRFVRRSALYVWCLRAPSLKSCLVLRWTALRCVCLGVCLFVSFAAVSFAVVLFYAAAAARTLAAAAAVAAAQQQQAGGTQQQQLNISAAAAAAAGYVVYILACGVSLQTVCFRVLSPLIHGSVQRERFFAAACSAAAELLSRLQQLVANKEDPLLQATACELLSAVSTASAAAAAAVATVVVLLLPLLLLLLLMHISLLCVC